ncbi:Flap endonuclease GEN 1 [Liparis tanakae]|uniref:Flap endonuclease GEN 1 n=1 Tax=Liparis tanakae TaxID=230148 RepID=A0A4Z2FZA4_9TELE|nr:Flap endonuclease GEN 1 [Liparis tanakae]
MLCVICLFFVYHLIFRKTLANQQFPFTEIIREFLIPKDKPVSHFKRRQPNMLMIQKFANDKMEWPKHYTSEKVLVLITYAEMMNRKYGREMSSQIKPLRILKPRVRNAVACFEVVWSAPEHYVFPEDRPAEDQQEVRTVEEESLFRVAYPEVVESHLRDKALAEENKNKKKRPKSKKEKPSEVSDGISDLLAQMTLQSSSNTNAQTLIHAISDTDEPEVVVLDSPVNHKKDLKSKEDERNLGGCPSPPPAKSEAAASLSVSAVIDALHLSDIDWDALSFSSSPTQQSAANHNTEPKLSKATDGDVGETKAENAKQKTSGEIKEDDSSAPLCYTDCPLRERLLMRNTAKLRSHSDPGQRDKDQKRPQAAKKSVCMSMCSSSEESDTENQQSGPQRKTQIKPMNKITDGCRSGFPLKHKKVQPAAKMAHAVQLLQLKAQRCSPDIEINDIPLSTKSRCQDISAAEVDGGVFLQTPASPVVVLDSDDSAIFSESPLPLAERLRLKFLK